MSENPVSNIGRVDPQNLQAAQVQASQIAKESGAAKLDGTQAAKQYQASAGPAINRETNLKFQVDTKTHQVTVMIMDRESNKVISTIPPDKIKDVPPGDLAHFLA